MIYVYGFVAGRVASAPPPGVAGETIQLLRQGGLVVAVGEVARSPAPQVDALRRHDAVVRALSGPSTTVLPARFGSVRATGADLAAWLEPRGVLIGEALKLVQGCEQMTVRTFQPRGEPGRSEGPEPEAAETAAGGPGTRYLEAKRRELSSSLPEVESLRRALSALVRAERVESHEAPPLVATLHHLVPRSRAGAYRRAVAAAAGSVAPFRVVATGPWAPYAFAPEGLS